MIVLGAVVLGLPSAPFDLIACDVVGGARLGEHADEGLVAIEALRGERSDLRLVDVTNGRARDEARDETKKLETARAAALPKADAGARDTKNGGDGGNDEAERARHELEKREEKR